jgi:hypothetical protein
MNMPGQDTSTGVLKTHIYDAAIGAYRAVVVSGSAEDHITLPAGANAAGFRGFTLIGGDPNEQWAIHMAGGIANAVAGAAFADGDLLMIGDNTGKVVKATTPAVTQLDAALVPASHLATLTKTPVALLAVKVNTAAGGQPTGSYKILPKGSAPGSGECALDANNKVAFNATNAVTSVDVEYLIVATPTNIVARALRAATADGDVIPVLPLHQTLQG